MFGAGDEKFAKKPIKLTVKLLLNSTESLQN
ncbi:hypothetical protein GECvBBS_gp110c [Salmonella phage GEC_vB_BS]|uniref:Uncharacterized protein n=1 Tax=Salmonella phage GEC_vB_BS TaxID=2777374 RepID=A0A7S9SPW6_9CAUD|nr:hypothetical protein GECvBBS_gp110c [Salmonella phage GEC_vB_BS]